MRFYAWPLASLTYFPIQQGEKFIVVLCLRNRGISNFPRKINKLPVSREIRRYFCFDDACPVCFLKRPSDSCLPQQSCLRSHILWHFRHEIHNLHLRITAKFKIFNPEITVKFFILHDVVPRNYITFMAIDFFSLLSINIKRIWF